MKSSPDKRLDLHRVLDSASFDHAVVLTYTFDPIFFEEYCLANLAGLHDCKAISVLLDKRTYTKIVTGPQMDRPKQANLRYLLHPIAVPGAFHPKLILLTSASKGQLLLGSANFTRPGLTANAELVGCYDFKLKEKETFAPLFHSAFAFIHAIATRAPTRGLMSNLQEMSLDTPWLEGDLQPQNDIELMTNLKQPLLTQLVAKIGEPIKSLSIVSRYFDSDPTILEDLLYKSGAQKIRIFTQNQYTNLSPSWLKHPLVRSGHVEVYLADYSSDDSDQPLHGKAFAFDAGKHCVFAYGSANCTTAALLRTAAEANLEDLLAIPLSSREALAIVPRLLDPEANARRLVDESQLISIPYAPDNDREEPLPITITEAEADDDRIVVCLEEPLNRSQLRAHLEFSAGKYVRISLKETASAQLDIKIDSQTSRRLSETSAIISIEDMNGTAQSNRMLITNLLDLQTGENRKKARYVKEAEQNIAGLLSVLYDLRSGIDEDALRTFLTFCDIPLELGPRPHLRFSQQSGASREGMRNLGQHNFKIALDLHELALKFCDRHFRKLARHVSDRRPDGVPNFLHISMAIAGVLESQIDRALTGLEARDRVTADEWFTFRGICDAYFSKYRELTTTLWDSYLSKLTREFPSNRIREAFEPELQPLTDLADRMMLFRDRVEKLRVAKCLGAGGRQNEPYSYFQSVFSEHKWPAYSSGVQSLYSSIVAAVKGEAIGRLDDPAHSD